LLRHVVFLLAPTFSSRPSTTQKRHTMDFAVLLTLPVAVGRFCHFHTQANQTCLQRSSKMCTDFEPSCEAEPSICQRQGQFSRHKAKANSRKHQCRKMAQTSNNCNTVSGSLRFRRPCRATKEFSTKIPISRPAHHCTSLLHFRGTDEDPWGRRCPRRRRPTRRCCGSSKAGGKRGCW
jgi:hypothetical protein